MRISAPGLLVLHHQSLFEWATSGLDEKISLKLVFDVFGKNLIKCMLSMRKYFKCMMSMRLMLLKVHKIENFFDSDFGICVISLLVMHK
jgi:hypothetical protein